MEHFQPIIVPPMAHAPQITSRQVADDRNVYMPHQLQTLPILPYTPLPLSLSPGQQRSSYLASTRNHQFLLRRMQTFHPAAFVYADDMHTFPTLKLAATPKSLLYIPQMRGSLNYNHQLCRPAPISDMQSPIVRQSSMMGVPKTPPCSIPGYFPRTSKDREPGIGETLLGCAILMLIGIALLAILYYLTL
jgi:hypothetical protein